MNTSITPDEEEHFHRGYNVALKDVRDYLVMAHSEISLIFHRGNLKWGENGMLEKEDLEETMNNLSKVLKQIDNKEVIL